MNYMATWEWEGCKRVWAESKIRAGGLCLSALNMWVLRNWNGILRHDWGHRGRDGLSPGVPMDPRSAVRLHHLSEMSNQGGDQGQRLELTAWVQIIASVTLSYAYPSQASVSLSVSVANNGMYLTGLLWGLDENDAWHRVSALWVFVK